MPDLRYRTCRHCGRPSAEVGPLSWTRACRECALRIATDNITQISAKAGPYFERQQRRQLMAAQRALLAAERETG